MTDTIASTSARVPMAPRLYFAGYGSLACITAAALAYGGARLLFLGGSPYYLLAALMTLAAGVQIARRRLSGVMLVVVLTLATIVWSLWESGFNGWALIPRLDWLIVMCLLLLAAFPFARRTMAGYRQAPYLLATGLPPLAALALIVVPIALGHGVELADASAIQEVAGPFSRGTVPSPDGNVAGLHSDQDWTAYAGSNLANHFTPAAQITPANVGSLRQAWQFHTGDLPAPGSKTQYLNENTPLKVGNLVYVCTPTQKVIAIDAATGRERWRFDPRADKQALETAGAYCRGVAYFRAPAGTAECPTRILWGVTGGRLAAIDAQTGQPCRDFGDKGFVDLSKGIGDFAPGYWGNTSAPVVIRGKVIIGHMVRDGMDRYAPSGVVRAFDAITGQFAWAWDLGRPGVTTQPGPKEHYTPGTPNVWAPISADDQLGLVYVGTGNAAGDFWGSTRTGLEDEYTDSVVAIDAATGRERWHFRTVNHDLWDFDIGPQPNLVDWPTPQGMRPAVVQATKSGQIFVLDRATGKPLTKVVQKPVPGGADGGNFTAPTQPFSVDMPNTVGRPGMTPERLQESDAWGISPFDQLACRIHFKSLRYDGMFTPPMMGGTLAYPGNHGGLNWGGASIDVQRGIMVINTNRLPYDEGLLTREAIDKAGSRSLNQGGSTKGLMPQVGLGAGAYKKPWLSVLGTPCIAPPWGYLSGIDLRTRRVVWSRPFGSGYDTGPLGIPSHLKAQMGTPSDSGALTTGGGVTIIGATLDNFMRAFDTRTGKLLWQQRVPAGPQGAPLSYTMNGKQYIVAVVGGHDRLGTTLGDSVIAWTLP